MTLQALASIAIRLDGRVVQYEPGAVFTVTAEQAARLLARAPGKLQALTMPPDLPEEPLQPGWLVCYRDQRGALCGGCDDRQHGTVAGCRWTAGAWTVHLTDGQRLPLSIIRGVTTPDGAAWTVREHGYDGEGPLQNRG
jgi:hypothetical protein